MPWTLYRHILKELLRLMLLSMAVMVLVISFAAAIKPMSEGLLDPWRLILFVLLSIPTMLMLVAPFAAAFSSTLVFSRMASDNEIVACAASGISYRTVLLPVFVLGLVLTLGLYWLSNWVVPWFFQEATQLVEKDITSLVVTQVRQGRPVEIRDKQGLMLYADAAEERALVLDPGADDAIQPHRLIMLRGVVIGQFDAAGKLGEHATADAADLYLYRVDGRTFARVPMHNVARYLPANQSYESGRELVLGPIELPDPFRDSPRFLSWPELKRLSREPQRYSRVARQKYRLTAEMAAEIILRELETTLASGVAVTLRGGGDLPHTTYALTAPVVRRSGSKLELTGDEKAPVQVQVRDSGLPTLRLEAAAATIDVGAPSHPGEPGIDIRLDEPQVTDERLAGRTTARREYTLRNAAWPGPVRRPLLDATPYELRQRAAREFSGAPQVLRVANALERFLDNLTRKILAQVSERFALAFSSLLVLLLGAVLSMKLRGAMPLVVYFCSFLLACLTVLITRSGENLATDTAYPVWFGPVLIWTGNALLCAVLVAVYARLARN